MTDTTTSSGSGGSGNVAEGHHEHLAGAGRDQAGVCAAVDE